LQPGLGADVEDRHPGPSSCGGPRPELDLVLHHAGVSDRPAPANGAEFPGVQVDDVQGTGLLLEASAATVQSDAPTPPSLFDRIFIVGVWRDGLEQVSQAC
jgi:hypothetical protein